MHTNKCCQQHNIASDFYCWLQNNIFGKKCFVFFLSAELFDLHALHYSQPWFLTDKFANACFPHDLTLGLKINKHSEPFELSRPLIDIELRGLINEKLITLQTAFYVML